MRWGLCAKCQVTQEDLPGRAQRLRVTPEQMRAKFEEIAGTGELLAAAVATDAGSRSRAGWLWCILLIGGLRGVFADETNPNWEYLEASARARARPTEDEPSDNMFADCTFQCTKICRKGAHACRDVRCLDAQYRGWDRVREDLAVTVGAHLGP